VEPPATCNIFGEWLSYYIANSVNYACWRTKRVFTWTPLEQRTLWARTVQSRIVLFYFSVYSTHIKSLQKKIFKTYALSICVSRMKCFSHLMWLHFTRFPAAWTEVYPLQWMPGQSSITVMCVALTPNIVASRSVLLLAIPLGHWDRGFKSLKGACIYVWNCSVFVLSFGCWGLLTGQISCTRSPINRFICVQNQVKLPFAH
jgi:hypothetical protein